MWPAVLSMMFSPVADHEDDLLDDDEHPSFDTVLVMPAFLLVLLT
jgi:hypothetical protein